MGKLLRDGTVEPVSRDQILRRERGQRKIHFPCSAADHEQDWYPCPVVRAIHTNIYIYIYASYTTTMNRAGMYMSPNKKYTGTWLLLLLLLFLTFSALVANPKKTTLHGGQSRSWSAEQGKKEKEKVWQRTPPPPARCSFGEKIINNKIKIRKSRGASTCLGATQAGVTQVVWVRLASVQGFLRLVS